MKSKEEIEQLAENSTDVQEVTYTTQHKITYNYYKRGYFEGYTQSQEDMAKLTFVPGLDKETLDELFDLHDDDDFIHEDSDKKYTDEDLKEAFKQSRQVKIFEKGMPPVWESFEDYINSLNKKD